MAAIKDTILGKIENRAALVGVVGLGYVGLPLSVEFARAGFKVTGIDTDECRVRRVNQGKSYILDVASSELKALVDEGRLSATGDYGIISQMDALSICVPTPLRKTKDPDISMIIQVVKEVAASLRKGQLIVLESTTYPGTTEEVIRPELEATGMKVGEDFFLAFSPERVDPGNRFYKTKNTPKIIGGTTPNCLEVAERLYQQAIDEVVPVSSTGTAEMIKLLENTFRAVNIGMVNEMALICHKLNVDVWEVIEAAGTKPFGFMPFYPGPGLGGHCIPVDPHYLSWKLRTMNYRARFIELADDINSQMPFYVVSMVNGALNNVRKSINGSQILVLGVTYKKDLDDVRESPALDIIRLLLESEARVYFHDPFVSEIESFDNIKSVSLTEEVLESMDCTVIVTNHSSYDVQWIVDHSSLVVDTRGATGDVSRGREKIVKL